MRRATPGDAFNALTVDVEDWFHILEVDGPPMRGWSALPARVEANTNRLLDLLSASKVRATFFVLGWIAENHPALVSTIAAAGHEIATHGYSHALVHRMTPEEFRSDLRRSLQILEGLCGRKVLGHRAAGYSLTKKCVWAFDIMAEEGLRYDASVCPAPHGHGGFPGFPLHPHPRQLGSSRVLWEFPVSCLQLGPWRLPFCGGGYLRLLPYSLIAAQIRRFNRAGHPAIVYLHPREVDPSHPRLPMPLVRRLKSYVNLDTTLPKLMRLLAQFHFKALDEFLP